MSTRNLNSPAGFPGALLEQYNQELQRYFSRRLGNRQDVRELTQEVWLRLCRVNDRERLREPMAYVYRTAANVLAEFMMRRRRDPVTPDTEMADRGADALSGVGPDELAERAQVQHDLLRAIGALPLAYRQIVWMRLCEDQSFQQIGEKLGFSEGTARAYYFRAIKQLWKAEWA